MLPTVGPPINFYSSDVYHMSTLIGTYDYILFSNDTALLNGIWDKYKLAVGYIAGKIDSSGMFNLDSNFASSWGKSVLDSGHTTDANMLVYRSLTVAAALADLQGESDTASGWRSQADTLKTAINAGNFDSGTGAFRNTDQGSTVYPEDGNSMALYYGGVLAENADAVSTFLTTQWNDIGAVCQEAPGTIATYVESFEIKGHLAIRQTQRALDLIRKSWGWYLNNPYGTGSTTIEGYYEDGSFYYLGSGYSENGMYISHSHGWATGPADALTSYVVGLEPTGFGGSSWSLSPQFGDLTSAEAGFTTPTGQFSAGWSLADDKSYSVWVNTPDGTSGTAVLPAVSGTSQPTIQVDGNDAGATFDANTALSTFSVSGGQHKITVTA